MGEHVIIVEDEPDIAELVQLHLERQGYRVSAYGTGREGLDAIRRYVPDLVVLDVMLPDLDGREVCRAMRSDEDLAEVPVLMFSARSEDIDVVMGLEIGADDYVTKPFSPAVLVSRIRNLLRRKQPRTPKGERYEVGELEIDSGRHEVRVAGELVQVTHTEFSILVELARRPGHVRSRQDILQAIDVGHVLERTVDVHVAALRKKLGPLGERLETVRGAGYRLRD
jgi:two-component system phosphate regulon response regulator PhoB